MLKVLLVDDTRDRASALKDALSRMEGVSVACTLESPLELLRRVAEHAPDLVLIDTESPSRDVLEQLAAVSSSAPRPVVMFADDAHGDAIRAALKVGVSAYIVDGIALNRLDPIMRVAIERFESDQQLRAAPAAQEGELAAWAEAGVLTRLSTAFSRDQPEKVYVQHRMLEEGEELWRWLAQGAHVYVCGDAKRMASDVDHALSEVVARHGAMSKEDAARHVKEMARAGRYQRDVY